MRNKINWGSAGQAPLQSAARPCSRGLWRPCSLQPATGPGSHSRAMQHDRTWTPKFHQWLHSCRNGSYHTCWLDESDKKQMQPLYARGRKKMSQTKDFEDGGTPVTHPVWADDMLWFSCDSIEFVDTTQSCTVRAWAREDVQHQSEYRRGGPPLLQPSSRPRRGPSPRRVNAPRAWVQDFTAEYRSGDK